LCVCTQFPAIQQQESNPRTKYAPMGFRLPKLPTDVTFGFV
jgi:hypothetical protein